MPKTFYSYSFGCRVNQAEKEMLDQKLVKGGFSRYEQDPAKAGQYSETHPDFYVINTCAVTAKAEREARQFIYQTRKKFPKTKIIITGCAATKWIKESVKIQEADLMIENKEKENIPARMRLFSETFGNLFSKPRNLLPSSLSESLLPMSNQSDKLASGQTFNAPQKAHSSPGKINHRLHQPQFLIGKYYQDKFTSSGRLFLKIQDGCQRFCTFCIVPYLRGQPKSERIENLEFRIRALEPKIMEVILTAINTQAFGLDTGETMTDLLEAILERTKIPRLSFGSIHPWSLDKHFIKFYKKYKNDERFAKFLHIPLQSGSNKILSLMKRGYTREEILEKLKTLEKIYPLTFFGTDIIAGFLEETDRDFEDTYNFLKDSPIRKFHVFRFSPREKTAAFFMKKRLMEPTSVQKMKRSKILIELGKKKYRQFQQKHLGQIMPALFLERRIDEFQEALLSNQMPILVKTAKDLKGEIKDIKISRLYKDRLTGNPL